MAFGQTSRPLEFQPAPYRKCRIEFAGRDFRFRAVDIKDSRQVFETRAELEAAVDAAIANGTFYGDF